MTADDVRIAIRKKFDDVRRYAVAEEVGLTTGFSHRRLDMMVLDCYYSNGFRIDGFEIKVSTSDLRHELADPEKHIAFFDVIDYYTLAAPKGVVDPVYDLIPPRWGILIINEDGTTRYKRKPLALEDKKADRDVPRGFLASIVRSIQGREPATVELQKQYDIGFEEGKKAGSREFGYLRDRIQRQAKDLDDYETLRYRLRLYSGDINDSLDRFEAFQQMRIDVFRQAINSLTTSLKTMDEVLDKALKDGKDHD